MTRFLLAAAFALLGLAPVGVCVGVWLAVGAGWGVCVGSVACGLLGAFLLLADVLPDPAPREVTR